MPPALFLFLTGVTLAFLMDSTERKGYKPRERMVQSLRRSSYLFFLAFAFRLQLWVFGLPAPWEGLFKVDVLNCMGISIALLSVMALFKTAERIRLCAVLGLAIAVASPVISSMDWSGVPWIIRNYIIPDYNSFGIFPWGAYLAFGVSAGSVIRSIPQGATDRCMQWAAILGGMLILTSQYFANSSFTLYSKSEYWLNSPAQVLTKVGVLFIMVSVAFLWTRYGAKDGWSWVRQFGTTSLLVYWGPHRAGLRARHVVLQRQSDGAADRRSGALRDPADARHLHHEDAPREMADGPLRPRLEFHPAPRYRRRRLI